MDACFLSMHIMKELEHSQYSLKLVIHHIMMPEIKEPTILLFKTLIHMMTCASSILGPLIK